MKTRAEAYYEYIETLRVLLGRASCFVTDEALRERIRNALWSWEMGAPRQVEGRRSAKVVMPVANPNTASAPAGGT